MSEKTKFESALQAAADKILHDLPEELAACLQFRLHKEGDMLVLTFPYSLHGTPEMQMLDTAAKRYGAGFVSRGKGEEYYLVPRLKATQTKFPAELANEATAQRETEKTKQISQPVASAPKDAIPEDDINTVPQIKAVQPGTPQGCAQFFAVYLQETQKQTRILEQIAVALEKYANRPTYRGNPPKELPKERHERDGINWLWDQNRTGEKYEKALEDENKNHPAYTALKTTLESALSAGKKGVLDKGCWCFLSTQKDWIGAKPARDFSKETNNGGKPQ